MTSTSTPTKSQRREMINRIHRPLVEEKAREAALEKLVSLLEKGAEDTHFHPVFDAEEGPNSLHRLSRLRAAHAAYALETTGGMERVGNGAWLRRRSSPAKRIVVN